MPTQTTDDHQTRQQVCLGHIVGAHGVRGLVTIRPYTEVGEDIVAYGPLNTGAGRRLSLVLKGAKKTGLIAAIDGVDSREAAQALKGVELFVDHDALPALDRNEWYHGDLIGLAAIGPQGEDLGAVAAVQNFGAGDLLEIKPRAGESFYVPLTREAVPEIDIQNRRLSIAGVEGLLELAPGQGKPEKPRS